MSSNVRAPNLPFLLRVEKYCGSHTRHNRRIKAFFDRGKSGRGRPGRYRTDPNDRRSQVACPDPADCRRTATGIRNCMRSYFLQRFGFSSLSAIVHICAQSVNFPLLRLPKPDHGRSTGFVPAYCRDWVVLFIPTCWYGHHIRESIPMSVQYCTDIRSILFIDRPWTKPRFSAVSEEYLLSVRWICRTNSPRILTALKWSRSSARLS